MHYIIRNIEKKDLPQLVVLCEQHAHYEQAEYSSEGKEAKLEKALFSIRPALYALVVEVDNAVVGFATYTFDFSTWDAEFFIYLDCLYLEPAFRGHGIGAKIIEILRKTGMERDCVNIQWQTPVFNEQGINFYKNIGGLLQEKARFILPLAI